MSIADQIRNYLAECGATSPELALTRPQIRKALGINTDQMSSGINNLKRGGYVVSVGGVRCNRHYVTGKQKVVPEPEIDRNARRRLRSGCVPRAEYLAACAAQREAKAVARKAKRKAKREANRTVAEQRRADLKAAAAKVIKAKVVAKKAAKVRAVVENGTRFTSIKPVQVAQVFPSSADFIAANPDKFEQLGGFAPRPFRAMPFNNRAEAA